MNMSNQLLIYGIIYVNIYLILMVFGGVSSVMNRTDSFSGAITNKVEKTS